MATENRFLKAQQKQQAHVGKCTSINTIKALEMHLKLLAVGRLK
jgi:hypothetical protein